MDRRVAIEKHFQQKKFSSKLSEERDYKKYGMYIYNINSLDDTGFGNYSSGNSFFEMLANFSEVENLDGDRYDILDKINFTFNRFINFQDFHSDAFHYLSYIDDPFELDFEKWAKLKVRDLYKYDIISPFRYYRFTWEFGVGVMPFYFRGQNIKAALKSFSFNHKRISSRYSAKQINYKTFVKNFYNFSTRVLGLNANPLGINADNSYLYNADRFLREAGFFETANPKKVFQDNTYYKRRQLVV
jgi:hypothetical protein